MVHDDESELPVEVGVGEEADEPLEDEGHGEHEALALHLLHDHLHLAHHLRVRVVQHFEEDVHVGDHALHRAVVVARQQLLADLLQQEERLLAAEALLQEEQQHRVHALAVPDVRVVDCEPLEGFSQLPTHQAELFLLLVDVGGVGLLQLGGEVSSQDVLVDGVADLGR